FAGVTGSLWFGNLGPFASAMCFFSGVVLWTLLEYLMHRFAFHGFAPHYQHHEDPPAAKYIVAPFRLSLPATGVLSVLLWLVPRSAAQTAVISSGVMAGYVAYEIIHMRLHGRHGGGRIVRALRKHHLYHHFANDAVCYGVTSPLWDFVFQSLPSRRAVPRA